MIQTDIALIGAGPIGLEMAVALKQAGLSYLHFEKRQIGQTIFWFPPQTRFFSSTERLTIAGMPLQTVDQSKASREEYLAYLREVVQYFDLDVRTYERVVRVDQIGGGFALHTDRAGRAFEYRARRLIVATGGTARPHRLGIEGENLPHVSHYFHEPHVYFRQRVLVVGGKNSAVEAALRCHHVGAKVAISYRGEAFDPKAIKYWLLPEITGLIRDGAIDGLFETELLRIGPDTATLQYRNRGEPFEVPADFVLLMTGYEADMGLCDMAGIELCGPGRQPRYDEATMETSIPGVYVAGTIVAGTQRDYSVFIENGHIHVRRILAALTGAPVPAVSARPVSELEA